MPAVSDPHQSSQKTQSLNFTFDVINLYLPGALGVAQNFSAIGKTLAVLSTLRYDASIPLPLRRSDAYHQVLISLFFTFTNSIGALILIIFLRESIADVLHAPEMCTLLFGVPIFMMARGCALALQQWYSREEAYGRVSISTIFESVIWNGGTALFGFLGWASSTAMVIAQVIGQTAASVSLAVPFLKRKTPRYKLPELNWAKMKVGMRRYRKFPTFNLWSKLLDNTALYIPALLFSAFFSPTVAGQFSLGFNLLQLPFAMLGIAIGQVLYQRAPAAQHAGSLPEQISKALSAGLLLGVFPALACAIIAPELVSLIFGANWAQAGRFAQVLSLWMPFILLSLTVERIPAVLEKNENILIFHALNTVVRTAALIIGGAKNDPMLAVIILGFSGMAIYLGNILSINHRFFQSEIGLVASTCLLGAGYYATAILIDPHTREFLSTFLNRKRP